PPSSATCWGWCAKTTCPVRRPRRPGCPTCAAAAPNACARWPTTTPATCAACAASSSTSTPWPRAAPRCTPSPADARRVPLPRSGETGRGTCTATHPWPLPVHEASFPHHPPRLEPGMSIHRHRPWRSAPAWTLACLAAAGPAQGLQPPPVDGAAVPAPGTATRRQRPCRSAAAWTLARPAAASHAQDLEPPPVAWPDVPAHATTADGFAPPGWRVERAVEGHLDEDGRSDLLLVLKMDDPANVLAHDGPGPSRFDTNPRMLVVALADADGYRRLVADHALIPRPHSPAHDD